MATWDQTDIVAGQPVKHSHIRQAQNDWQGDVAANGNALSGVKTLTVNDATPSTGVSQAIIKAGDGQSTTALALFQDSSGATMSHIGPHGGFATYNPADGKLKNNLLYSAFLLASDLAIAFNSGDDLNSLSVDVEISRVSAGRLKIEDGSGNARDVEVRKIKRTAASVSYSATPDFDLSLGELFSITLTGDAAATRSNPMAGHRIVVKIAQDATGGRAFTWPAEFLGGMDVGTGANEVSIQEFECFDGTHYEAVSLGVLR